MAIVFQYFVRIYLDLLWFIYLFLQYILPDLSSLDDQLTKSFWTASMSPVLDRDWDKSQHIMCLFHKRHVFSSIQDSFYSIGIPQKKLDKWFTPSSSIYCFGCVCVCYISWNGGHGAGHVAFKTIPGIYPPRGTPFTPTNLGGLGTQVEHILNVNALDPWPLLAT